MRRLLTLALALGLSAVVAVAAVDALRSSDEPRPPSRDPAKQPPEIAVGRTTEQPVWIEDLAGLGDRLRQNGVEGTLYLSADGCRQGVRALRALRLPELELDVGPQAATCRFTVSANGENAAGWLTVWSPKGQVLATETGRGEYEVIDTNVEGSIRSAGSAQAFKPDGTITHVRARKVVEWNTDCGSVQECSRTVLSRRELARALPIGDRLEAVDALVWLDSSRLLAVLRTAGVSWLAAYEGGRSLGYANGLLSDITTVPLADPTARYVALTPGGYLEIYDRDRGWVWASSIKAIAFDWSPDGDWLAYSGDDRNVYLMRTSDWTTRFSLPVSTESLAWR